MILRLKESTSILIFVADITEPRMTDKLLSTFFSMYAVGDTNFQSDLMVSIYDELKTVFLVLVESQIS